MSRSVTITKFMKDIIHGIKEFFLNNSLGGVIIGSVLSIVASVVVMKCEQKQNSKIVLYQNEMSIFADVRNSAAKLISLLSTDVIVDAANLLAKGEYDSARQRVSQRYDDLNSALSEFNIMLRTYNGTSNPLLNDLTDRTNSAVDYYEHVLNLLSKMCTMIDSEDDYENWRKSISLMHSIGDKEDEIFSKYISDVYGKYPLSPAGFCRYLINDALAMEENVALDKYLMIYTGKRMKEYSDSLKNQL